MKAEVTLEPLRGKHYSTNIHVKFPDHEKIYVEVSGYNHNPSVREIEENDWEPEDGMNHVEGDKVYEVACRIEELLKEMF